MNSRNAFPDTNTPLPAEEESQRVAMEARELLGIGFSKAKVARRLRIKPAFLRLILSVDISSRENTKQPKNDKQREVLDLVQRGLYLDEIMERTGITENSVREILRRLGIDAEAVSRQSAERRVRHAAILDLHQQGMTSEEIAESLSCKQSQVDYALDSILPSLSHHYS